MRKWLAFAAAWLVILAGAFLAHSIQTTGDLGDGAGVFLFEGRLVRAREGSATAVSSQIHPFLNTQSRWSRLIHGTRTAGKELPAPDGVLPLHRNSPVDRICLMLADYRALRFADQYADSAESPVRSASRLPNPTGARSRSTTISIVCSTVGPSWRSTSRPWT